MSGPLHKLLCTTELLLLLHVMSDVDIASDPLYSEWKEMGSVRVI